PWPIVGSFTAVVVGTVVIGNLYPSLYQRFRVSPNELVEETPYIEHNLTFTRLGFGLHDGACAEDGVGTPCMERRAFAYDNTASIDWTEAQEQMAGLAVWGARPLLTAYRELEALFPYYGFARVAIDRYPTADGELTPVAISTREVEFDGIQDKNWQNIHLRERYVAGVGAVASLAATRSDDFRPELLLRNIPPEAVSGPTAVNDLELERPEIFFGTRTQTETRYVVATAGTEQFAGPDGSPGAPGVDFPEGIALESTLRKLLLAWHFGDPNLVFSSELSDQSRLIHRRQVVSRARAVAPFVDFFEDPYPVIADGRVIWILEGFTSTAAYPLSALYDFGPRRRRYVRNSFKVTVDAVTGDLAFYRVPVRDPLADAVEEAYPDLVLPMSEMPEELRGHLRYPRVLLDLQNEVLLQYHQETARTFQQQQDVWDIPRELAVNENEVDYAPEYGVYRLPWESESRFQLTTVFVPRGRENLTAMVVARTDDRGVPELTLLDIPVGDQVSGPRQVESFVEQDPDISEQFSLWRTSGSQVWTGHLHLIPVGNRIVYMEPVFLAAEADAIPELRRFVVSDGRRVVMTPSLEASVAALAGAPPVGLIATDPTAPAVTATEGGAIAPDPSSTGGQADAWPAEALRLLEQAEERARQGDWQGYGAALDELRALLRRLGGEAG
ncbi:MAG: COG1615 family transporter, partial [Gemmatimonadetes bacterium]|nr:UPF0182 family protein [Gemmatimonadota bacterium]NNL29692.1 COG1615 family transporter [Gemmatimonadota bacterium]